METRQTVWIANDGGHNFAPAERYGRLQSFTKGRINPFAVDRLSQDLATIIGKYVKEDDYLLICGAHIISMLALSYWLKRFGKCKILQWGAKNRDYEMSVIDDAHMNLLLDNSMMGLD